MQLSFSSWNIGSGNAQRTERCVAYLSKLNPDVFGLLEVSGKNAFPPVMKWFPEHTFSIFENGDNSNQGILIGVRRSLQSFLTHRDELQSNLPTLRPGGLVTIKINEQLVTFLFVHLKAFNDPRSWGLRDDMFQHISSLKRKLGKDYPLICLGDFNTVGLNATYNSISDLESQEELQSLSTRLSRAGLKAVHKTQAYTWWNGGKTYKKADLDHVFCTPSFPSSTIKVLGWPEFSDSREIESWIKDYSDHALLYSETIIASS